MLDGQQSEPKQLERAEDDNFAILQQFGLRFEPRFTDSDVRATGFAIAIVHDPEPFRETGRPSS